MPSRLEHADGRHDMHLHARQAADVPEKCRRASRDQGVRNQGVYFGTSSVRIRRA